MAEYTQNLSLKKPDKTEQYNIVDFNENFDKIDNFAGLTPPKALTADKLTTGANINGIKFDGSKNVITGLGKYSNIETYNYSDIVYDYVTGSLTIYRSLIDNNIGNDLTDVTAWEETALGGGAYVGQTIFSLDPLYEDVLHLLDGTELPVGGIYDGFINSYITNLYEKAPQRFCSEAEWQASVEQYGVCGKYVYNAGISVRLPKVTGILEGTIDANALGDLVEAGLPNITGTINITGQNSTPTSGIGVFSYSTSGTWASYQASGNNVYGGLTFDASASNPIYGNSVTVQPKTIKGYYYIVIATSAKTDIEVNIDNVVTDLNNKVDISNMVDAGSYIAGCAMPSNKYVELTFGANAATYTAPANGWFQFIGGVASGRMYMRNAVSDFQSHNIRNFGTSNITGVCQLQVKKNDIVEIGYPSGTTASLFRFYYAVGSESEV